MRKTNHVRPLRIRLRNDFKENWLLYLMLVPVVLFYLIFHYGPMFGLSIAFLDYRPARGILGSRFVGFKHFYNFFTNYYFWRLLRNTIRISLWSLATFPLPIIFALLINELRSPKFSKPAQTIAFIPHFISTVVICGMIVELTSSDGAITSILHTLFGVERVSLLTKKENFIPIYVLSGIWQALGWDAIIYISALAGISPELYDAAEIDGAGRWQQMLHVTLPGLASTIIIMLILKVGKIFNVGYEKIILLYNPAIYETADVINTYVYRKGMIDAQYSYSAAVGLFNNIVSFLLVNITNHISKKTSDTGLW